MSLNNQLEEYCKKFICVKGETSGHTHTRIGDKDFNIKGGVYKFNNEDEFLKLYIKNVIENKKLEYLTEKQLEIGPIAIDIDLRYDNSVTERQHDESHIIDIIDNYSRQISNLCEIEDNFEFEVLVMHKPNVNILDTKTKDGIHIIFTINLEREGQIWLREKVIEELQTSWVESLPLTEVDDIIDLAVTKGSSNWQLYGSRKPNNEAYKLTNVWKLKWIEENESFTLTKINLENYSIKDNFKKLSVRNTENYVLKIKNEYLKEIDQLKNIKNKKTMSKLIIKEDKKISDPLEIKTKQDLEEYIEYSIEQLELNSGGYELKETHQFTMLLPQSFYGPGSYTNWIKVGWALKNTSNKLLPTFIKFSSQSKEFNIRDIANLVDRWDTFHHADVDGLTSRSIMYWAKNHNYNEYMKVRQNTISYYIEKTIKDTTDWDFAQVLYQLCKDNFVCVSIKNNVWYEFQGHKWFEIDSGNSLRLIISKRMHDLYMRKVSEAMTSLQQMDQSDQNYETMRKRAHKLTELCLMLKKTNWKNNIMKEAKELFYDKEFLNKLDNNPYLMCFNNYVVDFKKGTWRQGQPDDYISKCTNIDYIPLSQIEKQKDNCIEDVKTFMNQLFPNKELREYMWEHLSSTLIGNNDNQTFNIYTGSGRNGKSKLVELMSKMLGEYKASVPITLVTQKRVGIGNTSSEIVQLMGIRYAVMQEPSKGEVINEGIMKEITGGDPIQGRALFKESVTFIPQFKLVVCTNTLLDIKSNDDGTWRRIRVCDYVSKFLENPYEDEEKFPKEDYPYQYPVDKHIDEKFNIWAPVLASLLVEIAFKKKGVVNDCKVVMASSDLYREGQDYLAEFCKEKIKKVQGGKVKKTEIWEVFRQWYQINYGKNLPKAKELNEFMDKRFGKYTTKWSNIAINYEDDDDDDE